SGWRCDGPWRDVETQGLLENPCRPTGKRSYVCIVAKGALAPPRQVDEAGVQLDAAADQEPAPLFMTACSHGETADAVVAEPEHSAGARIDQACSAFRMTLQGQGVVEAVADGAGGYRLPVVVVGLDAERASWETRFG